MCMNNCAFQYLQSINVAEQIADNQANAVRQEWFITDSRVLGNTSSAVGDFT